LELNDVLSWFKNCSKVGQCDGEVILNALGGISGNGNGASFEFKNNGEAHINSAHGDIRFVKSDDGSQSLVTIENGGWFAQTMQEGWTSPLCQFNNGNNTYVNIVQNSNKVEINAPDGVYINGTKLPY
jgi:hypothetical protein